MKILDDIKNRIVKKNFKKKYKLFTRENKRFSNLKNASSIGIIYDKVELVKTNKIINLSKQFIQHGKMVKIIAYVPDKQEIKNQVNYSDILYYSKNDTLKNGTPKLVQLKMFMNESFDILIDFCEEDCLQTLYITAFSKAKLKTGIYSEEKEFHDLLIKSNNFDDCIKYIINYLNIIAKF